MIPVLHKGRQSFFKNRAFLHSAGCTGDVMRLSLSSPILQVYGSNTDVGKSVISAVLCRTALENCQGTISYIKPLQTGESKQHDVNIIKKTCLDEASENSRLHCDTLFSWDEAVSPHLAAKQIGQIAPTDHCIIAALQDKLEGTSDFTVIETAGGVCTPAPSCTSQADLYRPLRLPVLLVADGKLGGISATISALESLLIRGYDVVAIACIENRDVPLDNALAIEKQVQGQALSIPIFRFDPLPSESEPLYEWISANRLAATGLYFSLRNEYEKKTQQLQDMAAKAQEVVWWPFTQHSSHPVENTTVIDSAYGNSFSVYRPQESCLEPMFDACASWWTQGVGHGNPNMAMAIARAAARYGHVMFP